MNHDLIKLQDEYYEAEVGNVELFNKLASELSHRLFDIATFFLLFIATLFFFLATEFKTIPFLWSVKTWLIIAIISSTLSVIMGFWSAAKTMAMISDIKTEYAEKRWAVKEYVEKNNVLMVTILPTELDIDHQRIKTDSEEAKGWINLLTILQLVLVLFAMLSAIIAILGAVGN